MISVGVLTALFVLVSLTAGLTYPSATRDPSVQDNYHGTIVIIYFSDKC